MGWLDPCSTVVCAHAASFVSKALSVMSTLTEPQLRHTAIATSS